MAKEAGSNVKLYISDGGSPTSFALLAGQQSTELVGGTETDDITDKGHTGWGSTLNVLRRFTVNVQGKANWLDTTGLDLIRAAWIAGSNVECKLIVNSNGSNYIGLFQVTQFNVSGTHLNATEYSCTMVNNGTITYSAS